MSRMITIKSKVKAIGVFDDIMKKRGFSKTSTDGRTYQRGSGMYPDKFIIADDGTVTVRELDDTEINSVMQDYSKALFYREAAVKGLSVTETKQENGDIKINMQ